MKGTREMIAHELCQYSCLCISWHELDVKKSCVLVFVARNVRYQVSQSVLTITVAAPFTQCNMYAPTDLTGQAQWLEYKLSLNIERNTITSCGYGFGSNHYNRDIGPDEAFYYHRYSNETVHLVKNTIRDSQRYAILVSSPLWDPLTSSLAEIVYNLTGKKFCQLHKN